MAPVLPGLEAPAALTDHLLEEFFVRIDAPADLIRASAACKTFRRLITDPTFLRRYRSVHPPLLLGFVFPGAFSGFLPADTPHPNAPAARAFAGAADFTFCQLPPCSSKWSYCHARDGRVLMLTSAEGDLVLPELAVCDPLTQGYMLLPPIPDELLTSVSLQIELENDEYFDAFFDPSESYEQAQFRVMCWTRNPTMGAIFIYSSISGTWTHGASIVWRELGLDAELPEDEDIVLPDEWPSYAYGCLYWKEFINNKLIKLNINTMEFSAVSLPADYEKRDIAVVEAGEGRIGMFSLINGRGNPQPLRYSIRQSESENPDENPVETTIPLPNEYDLYSYDGAAEGYIFLLGYCRDPMITSAFFSLEIKTMKVERVSSSYCIPHHLIPYFGFPPSMSPRRI